MKQTEKNAATAAVGLDIGTSRIVIARGSGQDPQVQAQLNAFVTIPYTKMTESVLRKENIPCSVQGNEIIVHGNEAERFADLLHTETRRPMTRGTLNPSEPESLNLIQKMVSTLTSHDERQGQKLCFSIPAPPIGGDDNLTYHEASLRQILTELGYTVKSINEGLAVVYSELESSNYTGIGVSCGGGLCNVCLAYLTVPVLSFSIAKAGDFIDASAAAVTGERANRIRLVKEDTFQLNGNYTEKIHQVLGVYYDDMIHAIVQGLKQAFAEARTLPRLGRPIPLVLSGGSSLPQGFRDRFDKLLRESDFPIPLSEVRLAANPLFSTARGALTAALTDM